MSNRYFLSTLFPTLSLTEAHTMSLDELKFTLTLNLSSSELTVVKSLWVLGDVENVRSFFHDEPMTKKGSYKPEELENMIDFDEKKPVWLNRFLSDFPNDELRCAHTSLLSRYCLMYAPQEEYHPTIKELLAFDFAFRSVLEFVRGGSLPYEGPLFLTEPQAEWPEEFRSLIHIWEQHKQSPLLLEQKIAEWRFTALETKREACPPFSLARLLYSIALFLFIESRRPLVENTQNKAQERIIQAS